MLTKRIPVLLSIAIGLLNYHLPAGAVKTRLVGGPTTCSGRVEVFHDNAWGTVCDDGWTMQNTEVVCNSVDCGTAMTVRRSAFYGEGKDRIWLDDVTCTGKEASIGECGHRDFGFDNCGHNEDIGVICSDHLKLVNGTRCSGRVQVQHGSQWRKICKSHLSLKEQEVICRELSCGTPVVGIDLSEFGDHSTLTAINMNCLGNETTVTECMFKDMEETCEDASVVCTYGKLIQLVNGTTSCSGRVEIFHESQWGTVCDDSWGLQEAQVACREMKCGTALAAKYTAFFGPGSGMVLLDDLGCNGHETSLVECHHAGLEVNDCSHLEDAGVICAENVNLVNGSQRCSGRLEVRHNGQWGKICRNSNWGSREDILVCKELDCGKPDKNAVTPVTSVAQNAYTTNCVGGETSIAACQLQLNSGTCEAVTLSCSGQQEIKLINGTDRCSGRLEVQHDGQWGTVCDDYWDIMDASVVCREMDCGTPLYVKAGAYYGQGSGNVWLDDLECLGNETSIKHCKHTRYGDSNCGHAEDAGVQCSMTIRLLNGSNHCSGRVEVFQAGQWAPVFNRNWGVNEALVVCKEMQCGEPVVTSTLSDFGQTDQVTGYTAKCNGRESSITQCSLTGYAMANREHVAETTVVCSGNMRLAGGTNKCSGRVEMFRNGQWGTICSDSWNMQAANVVCKNIQCGKAQKIPDAGFFGQAGVSMMFGEVSCTGREHSLDECELTHISSKTCNSTSDVGVHCSDGLPTRLINPTGHQSQCFGRVEVQHAGQWGSLCSNDWSISKAQVVCDILGCGKAASISGIAEFGQGTGLIWEASDLCFENEASLFSCSIKGFNSTRCSHTQDASVVCADPIRLVHGRSECSGRLEIFHSNSWGTVCDDEWELANADVVCRQLGCGHALTSPGNSQYGEGTGPIWLDNVVCNGEEAALSQCSHQEFGQNNCGHREDVSVVCLGNLPKPHLTLNPGPEVNLGERVELTCSVVTEHMGATFILEKTPGPFKITRYSESDAVSFTFPKANFSHNGLYHCSYQKRFLSRVIDTVGDSVELKVTVKLQQPIISLPSGGAMMLLPTDKIEVKGGSSFAVSCSIFSNYEGGSFSLRKSNSTALKPKVAQSHTVIQVAYFDFPDVTERDQGDYACVYTLNVSSKLHHSVPSKTLHVTVSGSAVSSTVTGSLVGLSLVLLLAATVFLLWRRRGLASRTMVQFSSRVGVVLKEDIVGKRDGLPSGRDYDTLANEYGSSTDEGDSHMERTATEDLTGRVSYDLEPLIHE